MNNVITRIKNIYNSNVLFQGIDFVLRYVHNPINFKYSYIRMRTEHIDSILNYDRYVKFINKHIGKGNVIAFSGHYNMSNFYGHFTTIEKYSKIKRWIVPFLGEIEHGIRFDREALNIYDKDIFAYTVQGKERLSEIVDSNLDIPIFGIGPYIRYAESYYSEKQFNEIKKEMGKTLLLFPSHSFELDDYRLESDNFIKWVLQHYANNYDTVLVCVYWHDTLRDDIKQYESYGFRLCTAGARIDRKFLARLKSIISLADLVIGNDLGTNIGYCMALGKSYILYSEEINRTVYLDKYVQNFSEAFFSENGSFQERQIEEQKDLFIRFWGGDIKLEPEDFQMLFSVIKKVMKKSGYNINTFKKYMKILHRDGLPYISDKERIIIKTFLINTDY